jgi:hypothetical protein
MSKWHDGLHQCILSQQYSVAVLVKEQFHDNVNN